MPADFAHSGVEDSIFSLLHEHPTKTVGLTARCAAGPPLAQLRFRDTTLNPIPLQVNGSDQLSGHLRSQRSQSYPVIVIGTMPAR